MSVLQVNFCRLGTVISSYRYVPSQRLSVCAQYLSPKATIEEKLGIKPKPKKPLSAFFRFRSKVHAVLAKQNPNANIQELVKLAATEWKKVDEKLKNELQEEYRLDWKKYQESYKEYDKNLSPGEREEIAQAKRQMKFLKEKRELRKKREELGRPKKPPSPFVLYSLSKASQRGDMSYKDWQIEVAKSWKASSEKEKETYMLTYKKEMEVYKGKLSDWEKKMLKEGRQDVEPESITKIKTEGSQTKYQSTMLKLPEETFNNAKNCTLPTVSSNSAVRRLINPIKFKIYFIIRICIKLGLIVCLLCLVYLISSS